MTFRLDKKLLKLWILHRCRHYLMWRYSCYLYKGYCDRSVAFAKYPLGSDSCSVLKSFEKWKVCLFIAVCENSIKLHKHRMLWIWKIICICRLLACCPYNFSSAVLVSELVGFRRLIKWSQETATNINEKSTWSQQICASSTMNNLWSPCTTCVKNSLL